MGVTFCGKERLSGVHTPYNDITVHTAKFSMELSPNSAQNAVTLFDSAELSKRNSLLGSSPMFGLGILTRMSANRMKIIGISS